MQFGVFQESALESVVLPSTLKRIEGNTFRECRGLEDVELPEGLEYIGKKCFKESGLESISLPSTLKTVEENTFRECENLREIEFSEGLEKICRYAFVGSGLEQVEFPDSLRTVERGAFAECDSLGTVKFGEGLEVLGTDEPYDDDDDDEPYGVFENSAVESVELPSTLKRIECGVFYSCEGLKKLDLPEGLEYIGEGCFYGSGLEEITLPGTLRDVGEDALRSK